MQKVYLNGAISSFGSYFEVDCKNTRDVIRLLSCQLSGFREHLLDAAEAGIGYEIIKGSKVLTEAEHLMLGLSDEDLIITEVPVGSKGGFSKIILAIVLVAVAVYMPIAGAPLLGAEGMAGFAGQLMVSVAVSLAISGITELLTSSPEVDSSIDGEEGYLFNGPTNTLKYGQAIPVAYGEIRVGGSPINSYYQGSPI